jgi:hypothetical protein
LDVFEQARSHLTLDEGDFASERKDAVLGACQEGVFVAKQERIDVVDNHQRQHRQEGHLNSHHQHSQFTVATTLMLDCRPEQVYAPAKARMVPRHH